MGARENMVTWEKANSEIRKMYLDYALELLPEETQAQVKEHVKECCDSEARKRWYGLAHDLFDYEIQIGWIKEKREELRQFEEEEASLLRSCCAEAKRTNLQETVKVAIQHGQFQLKCIGRVMNGKARYAKD